MPQPPRFADISEGPAGNSIVNQARVVAQDGTGTAKEGEGLALRITDVLTLTYSIFNVTLGTTIVSGASLTPANVLVDTLTDDSIWSKDATGRNFKNAVAGSNFATAGHTFWVVYTFTTTGGTVAYVMFMHTTFAVSI